MTAGAFESKLFGQSRLFEYRIGGMARLYFSIYDEMQLRYRTSPNFVVALAGAHKLTLGHK